MSGSLPNHAAATLRAEMARRELTPARLAQQLGVSEMWVSRRMRGKTQITMADLERLATALSLPLTTFLPDPERVA